MRKSNIILLALCVGLTFYASGCKKQGDQSRRGVTDTAIRIGQWGPQSGPAALWGAVARGSECYFKMLNDEGGIAGRKIEYFLRDDAYLPNRTKTEATRLLEEEGVFGFVGGLGTATGMAVKQYLEENKVPWVNPSSPSYHWSKPHDRYLFSIFPMASVENAVMIDYALKDMGKKKIATFYQNDDYGRFGLVSAQFILEKKNMRLGGEVSTEAADTDLSSHALKLRETGADTVIIWTNPKQATIIIGQCDKIGYRPQWMVPSSLSDMAIMHKITRGLWKDVIFCCFVDMPDSSNPLMKKYKAAQEKYAPNERWGVFYYAGFMFAEPMVEGLKKCGKDLTIENFIAAMESIKGFQGIGPKVTYTASDHQGANSVFLSQCLSDTKYKRLTDWRTADVDLNEIIKRMK